MKTTQAPLLALLALLSAPAFAQDSPPAQATVRVQAVKAIGKLKKDAKPAVPPALDSVKATLLKTPYDRFEDKGPSKARGLANAPLRFASLPEGYSARISWSEGKDGELVLSLVLDRQKKGTKAPVQVAKMKVRLKDGASYLLKCPGTYADGDLLLVITASRKPL